MGTAETEVQLSPKTHGTVDDHGLNLGHAAGVRRSLDQLGSILRPGERIVCGAQGFLEGRPGLVIATSSRFLFVYRDETPIDSPYEEITRFRAKVGIVASDLEIEDANGVASIRQIHPRARLADLAGVLQKGPGAAPGAPLPGARPGVETATSPVPGAAPPIDDQAPGSLATPAGTAAVSETAVTAAAEAEDWKPKLRPKISPLPARHEEAAPGAGPTAPPAAPAETRAPSSGIGGTAAAVPPAVVTPTAATPTSPSPVGARKAPAWQPRLGVVGPAGDAPEPTSLAARRGALTSSKGPVPLPLADQLLPGEWVVATFADLTATTEGHEKEASASVAVTNRRLLLLTPSGTPVEAWPLQAVEVQESAGGGRARLVGGIDLEFTSSELAAGFSEAMRNATGLHGS